MPKRDSITVNLVSKYKPRTLSEIRGQPEAVSALRSFVASVKTEPVSLGFVFHGPTGVGKTAAALALAYDLGCSQEDPDLGGICQVPSGKQDGRAVDELLRSLRLRPLLGSGWKVAIINEADKMTDQAEGIWLDGLEDLPPKSVIVFTTNELGRLTDRLTSRCEVLEFSGSSLSFKRGLRQMVRTIWQAETGQAISTVPKGLGCFELASGEHSIRLALQQISPYLRQGRKLPESFSVPFIREVANGACVSASSSARKAWDTRRRQSGNGKGVAHVS